MSLLTSLRLTSLRQLWRGQLPLGEAFWRYSIVYNLLLNVLATATAAALVVNKAPIALAVIAHLASLPYSICAAIGMWRSADRYAGPRLYADAAKVAVMVWTGLWLIL